MQKFKNIYSFDSQLKLIKESCHMSSRDKLTLMFQEACFAKYMNKVKKLTFDLYLRFFTAPTNGKINLSSHQADYNKKTMHTQTTAITSFCYCFNLIWARFFMS